MQKNKLPVVELRSKSWDEFAAPGAAQFDSVFTVCDNAAGEACPARPDQPMTAHWGIEDPAAVEGSDEGKREAFSRAFTQLNRRLSIFVSLPMEKLDNLTLKSNLEDIRRLREQGE